MQSSAIPVALEGKDLLATAQTGTGKTLAFLIPLAQQLLDQPRRGIRALVLVPTRELAIQVNRQFDELRGKKLAKAALVIGGASEGQQISALRSAQLLIATPGRLEDFLRRGLADLRSVQTLVLDEADRMLDMGFLPAIRRIVQALPTKRQTLCFSATLDKNVAHVIDEYLRNPVRLALGSTSRPASSVKLQAFEVSSNQRFALLQQLLGKESGRCLVFVRTKRNADRLARKLAKEGFAAGALHGDRTQSQRNAALAAFQNGTVPVLVATDVASRGIHVDDIAHVINYELPELAEDLIHRVGRTGRIGAEGVASVFVCDQERSDFARMERELGLRMQRMKIDANLAIEQRPQPVVVRGAPTPAAPGSKMVRLPGEVLQRYCTA
ncbi:MAG TPA: DEAD/DEAH box helicase [Terriglobales bacterium]|nr:DEAD/DEAH box helicase [Terriglobales bacterium]